jgi:hypothetical protein
VCVYIGKYCLREKKAPCPWRNILLMFLLRLPWLSEGEPDPGSQCWDATWTLSMMSHLKYNAAFQKLRSYQTSSKRVGRYLNKLGQEKEQDNICELILYIYIYIYAWNIQSLLTEVINNIQQKLWEYPLTLEIKRTHTNSHTLKHACTQEKP